MVQPRDEYVSSKLMELGERWQRLLEAMRAAGARVDGVSPQQVEALRTYVDLTPSFLELLEMGWPVGLADYDEFGSTPAVAPLEAILEMFEQGVADWPRHCFPMDQLLDHVSICIDMSTPEGRIVEVDDEAPLEADGFLHRRSFEESLGELLEGALFRGTYLQPEMFVPVEARGFEHLVLRATAEPALARHAGSADKLDELLAAVQREQAFVEAWENTIKVASRTAWRFALVIGSIAFALRLRVVAPLGPIGVVLIVVALVSLGGIAVSVRERRRARRVLSNLRSQPPTTF